MNGKHTVFGKLVSGFHLLDAIEKVQTGPQTNRPLKDIVIKSCGQLTISNAGESENAAISIEDKVKGR